MWKHSGPRWSGQGLNTPCRKELQNKMTLHSDSTVPHISILLDGAEVDTHTHTFRISKDVSPVTDWFKEVLRKLMATSQTPWIPPGWN